jgi:hypothetical protein
MELGHGGILSNPDSVYGYTTGIGEIENIKLYSMVYLMIFLGFNLYLKNIFWY